MNALARKNTNSTEFRVVNLNRGLIKSVAQEVVMQAMSAIRDRVNLFIGESHVRYLLSKKASSNPVFLNKIRKSNLLEDVYFVWSQLLA